MPWRTSACSTGSRCRGGKRWRVANDLAATGRERALSAMSMTAAMAKAPLRGRSGIGFPKIGERLPKLSRSVLLVPCPWNQNPELRVLFHQDLRLRGSRLAGVLPAPVVRCARRAPPERAHGRNWQELHELRRGNRGRACPEN